MPFLPSLSRETCSIHTYGSGGIPNPSVSLQPRGGKLQIRAMKSFFPRQAYGPLSVSVDHAAGVEMLEVRHRDPFDRLLIVQARLEGLRLLTADDQVLAYGNPTVDARAR